MRRRHRRRRARRSRTTSSTSPGSRSARGITEGKFDDVRGKDVLVITGRFGFKTYDVENPEKPKLLDEFIPADLEADGYWQNEDMELDTKRKLIIGALDPRHTEKGATSTSPCPPNGSTSNVNCRSGFYVISYANPSEMKQIGDFVEPAVRPHVELHPGLQVHLDRRSGAAQRPAVARSDPGPERAGPVHVHPRRRQRPADLGHGSHESREA